MKLININIEKEKHLNRVLPFIEKEKPDVLCLQEVCEASLSSFNSLGYVGEFLPETKNLINNVPTTNGTALLSCHPMHNFQSYYYRGNVDNVTDFDSNNVTLTQQKAVLLADCDINGSVFRIGTAHFTWTPDGSVACQEQLTDMEKFFAYTEKLEPHIMCGDFNIPRHQNPLYQELLAHYTDTVPSSYASSLDATLHRLGKNPDKQHLFTSYMVDYIFTQSPYVASKVRLEFGISDHAAVVADISKD